MTSHNTPPRNTPRRGSPWLGYPQVLGGHPQDGQPAYYQKLPSPAHQEPPAPPKQRYRVFPWAFLAIQAIFLAWLITSFVSTGDDVPSGNDLAQACANGAWHGLFNSYQDCASQTSDAFNAAHYTTVGAGFVIGLWAAVDFIIGLPYLIYRLATRRRTPYAT